MEDMEEKGQGRANRLAAYMVGISLPLVVSWFPACEVQCYKVKKNHVSKFLYP